MANQSVASLLAALNASVTAHDEAIRSLQKADEDAQWTNYSTWRLLCGFLVFLMQVGFSLLEAGTVRSRNTRNIMVKNILDVCFSLLAFWSVGYALALGNGNHFFGWKLPDGSGATAFFNPHMQSTWFFMWTFSATCTTIVAGAVAERCQLRAYIIYSMFASSLLFPINAHILWASDGLLSVWRNAIILGTDGAIDNAGGAVVHVTGGVASLVAAWMLGPREGRFDLDKRPVAFKGHSMVFVGAGTLILWTGFFAFNSGSVVLTSLGSPVWRQVIAGVAINTALSASAAAIVVFVLSCTLLSQQYRLGSVRSQPGDLCNAVLGGCVAACSSSAVVQPWAAAIIGAVAGGLYLAGVVVLLRLKVDDPVNACPVHLVCGAWGVLSVGIFATSDHIAATYGLSDATTCGLLFCGSFKLLGVQLLALLLVCGYTGAVTLLLFGSMNYFGVLRVGKYEEELGLDVALHGASLDDDDNTHPSSFEPTVHIGIGVGGRPVSGLQKLKELWRRLAAPGLAALKEVDVGGSMRGRERKTDAARALTEKKPWSLTGRKTALGVVSFAEYPSSYIMEDVSQVDVTRGGVYLGVYDGHFGPEAAAFLREHLFVHIQTEITADGCLSEAAVRRAFEATETALINEVSDRFETFPHMATVSASAVVAVLHADANELLLANVGDARAVLGTRRPDVDSQPVLGGISAVELSRTHNVNDEAARQEFLAAHPEDKDVVALDPVRGRWRIRDRVEVSHAFGASNMKINVFNRDPLFPRFRVPYFERPLLLSEPWVVRRKVTGDDKFVVLASSGVWEYLTPQEAVNIVFMKQDQPREAARLLVRSALQRAATKHEVPYRELMQLSRGQRRDFHDDLSAVVFFFHRDGPPLGVGANGREECEEALRHNWSIGSFNRRSEKITAIAGEHPEVLEGVFWGGHMISPVVSPDGLESDEGFSKGKRTESYSTARRRETKMAETLVNSVVVDMRPLDADGVMP